ncbi:Rieske (2Fe-2S) protein [Yinghuangia soli]|uniref:Rieske 2Fe-2S domain-containing protein n=1 Tax=Yinghuangia soli TaxID=2908204 RepID=A0AA41PZ17_9ACTN|nr:Rieske 2Fe-2S domain-containing protein [Yinghuangia soli]MCF2528408.1 Rieske 2Fe-2S domain-containing protein [Yinghuangia soli]
MKVPFRRDHSGPPPPTAPPEGALRVGALADVPEGTVRRIADRPAIALVRHGDTVHAFEDRCPHAGALLSRGTVAGDEITCPSHRGIFRVDTGKSLGDFNCRALRTYAVAVVDGIVYVDTCARAPRDAKRGKCPDAETRATGRSA